VGLVPGLELTVDDDIAYTLVKSVINIVLDCTRKPKRYDWRNGMRLFALWNKENTTSRINDIILLFVYALIFGVLMSLYLKMDRGAISLIAFIGFYFPSFAWSLRVVTRLREARMSGWYVIPLVCAPMILLVFLVQFKVIGGMFALVLFVFTQIPIAFLRRKHKPDEMDGCPGPSDQ
jgi:hypothetical protein